jgi:hypothetical protein
MNLELFEVKINELKKINMKKSFNYSYTYFDTQLINGNLSYIYSNNKNKIYGDTRKGFEKYKLDKNHELLIGYSGEISVRNIIKKNTNEIIGCIFETKLSNNDYIEQINQIYKELKEYTIKELNVIDIDSFNYYLSQNSVYDFNIKSSKEIEINFLYDLIKEYNENIEFQKFFNKIIR